MFIGPIEPLARVDKVRNMRNIHFLGKQPYSKLPNYLAGFDVCVNPFVLGKLADSVSPIKLYEYLASGKPVVSVDMSAAQQFVDVIPLTRTQEEFLVAIENVLAERDNGKFAERAAARQAAAADSSWSLRFDQIQVFTSARLSSTTGLE